MPAIHKSTTYKPGNLPNPFQQGQDRAYADILLDKTKEVHRWRLVGFGALALFALSIFIFTIAVFSQKTVPVLINVMPSGEAVNLGEVRHTGSIQVPEQAVLFQIRKFITDLRSISTDPEVLYNNINECYFMVTSTYNPIMTRTLRDASPFDLVGKVRRTVEIESVLQTTGRSYQVDWVESTLELSGGANTPRNRKMRAVVTVKLVPPDNSFIKTNPLGIFIDNCEWTEL